MIPVTDEPMEGVAFDVEDHAQRTGTNWTCYPRYLGITRRSCLEAHMVLDMKYREQE